MTDLSIIVVNWNGGEDLSACLESIPAAAEGLAWEAIVVDNASTDGSADDAARKFPPAHLVRNGSNRGFSGGVNDGIARASSPVFLILNPDIVLVPGTLPTLVSCLREHPGAAAVAASLREADGSRQHGYLRKLPTLKQVLLFHTLLESWARRVPLLVARYLEEDPGGNEITTAEQLPGAFLLTSREVVDKVGKFDERFKLFYEDVDWSFRAREAGYDLLVHMGVAAFHRGRGTLKGEAAPWVQGRLTLSLMLYFDLHKGWIAASLTKAIAAVNALVVAAIRTLQLLVPGPHRAHARLSRDRAVYFLQIAFETYVLCRNVPLIPAGKAGT